MSAQTYETPVAFCHRCQRETPTVYISLSSGHIGNCCAVCHATRKGRPFISRTEYAELTNAREGRRSHEQTGG